MNIVKIIYDLSEQGYIIKLENNGANRDFLAITLSNHGLHVRSSIHKDKLNSDRLRGSLKFMKERLDLMAKGKLIN